MRHLITFFLLVILSVPFKGATYFKTKHPETTLYDSYKYDINEVLILAKLINSEAKSEPMLGKIAVGNVVLNRARRRRKSIKYIVLEKGQFDGVRTKYFRQFPSEQSIEAAKIALRYSVLPGSIEFFHNPVTSTDGKWVRYIEKFKYKQIGRHLFCHNPKLRT